MRRRSPPKLPFTLICILIGMLLLVRMVDLHWHQHLRSLITLPDGSSMPVTYIADLVTPHLASDLDNDVPMSGDEASARALPALPVPFIALILLLLIAPKILVGLWLRRGSEPRSPQRFRSPQLPPPLRGPPSFPPATAR